MRVGTETYMAHGETPLGRVLLRRATLGGLRSTCAECDFGVTPVAPAFDFRCRTPALRCTSAEVQRRPAERRRRKPRGAHKAVVTGGPGGGPHPHTPGRLRGYVSRSSDPRAPPTAYERRKAPSFVTSIAKEE